MLANDLALALDPAALATAVGLEPDPWQADALRSTASSLLLNCCRQSGKSSVSAILALHEALYRPPALVLLLSPSLRQSQELIRKVKDAHAALGRRAPAEESALRLEWPNGSRIVCLPAKESTIRGFSSVSMLIEDEAARVDDRLYIAIRPMLAVSGGRIILLSTPFGKRGHFHHEWAEGGTVWHRVKITAQQCPRIPREWLERERAAIGDWWYAQEYECEFVEPLDQVFRYQDIMAALDPQVAPLFGPTQ
jgi:hypothetical protein